MNQHTGINIFNQFGFKERSKSGAHLIGNCPFCGKPDHFFLNAEAANKSWDCKVCLRQGGFKTFLRQIVDYCADTFTPATAKKLLVDRGNTISYDTMHQLQVGFHPYTGQYVIPVFDAGENVMNVKLYNFHAMRNASGCSAAMYGLWLTDYDKCTDIFVAEGEWDAMVLYEMISSLGLSGIGLIGVPGAGTFKQEVLPYLNGKKVHLLYDNDEAGQKGMEKAAVLLADVAREIFALHWPEGTADGCDIRDIRKAQKTPEKLYEFISENLAPVSVTTSAAEGPKFTGEIVKATEVYDMFKKHLHIPDTTLLDVVFGTVLANRLPGDPLWMFVVAPPGATKTEPLLAFSGANVIEILSTLTPHTLISGTNFGGGGDPSLVPKLNGKVLIIKDFTTILTMPVTEREEIFGILRDVYDGECSKPFGNGIFRKYKSKFGILAAVTPVIEMFTEEHAALGERFLRWRNYVPTSLDARRVYIKKAISNVGKEVEIRADLVEITHRVLEANYDIVPEVPDKFAEKIICLAQLVAILRGTVTREKYTKEITHKPFIELGTRVSKQLVKLMLGVAIFRQKDKVDASDYRVAVQVARSSVPLRLLEVFEHVYECGKEGANVASTVKAVGLPMSTCTLVMENLCMLRAIEKHPVPGGNRVKYIVNKEMCEYVKNSQLF